MNDLSDEALLVSTDPAAFGVFYARHLRAVETYFGRRGNDHETAADLAADTFASALVARRRFVPCEVPAQAWLYAIARRRLVDHRRRAAVDQRRVEDLHTELNTAGGEDVDTGAEDWLRYLPDEQRDAVRDRVLRERAYSDLARRHGISEATARQRVSRGIAALREPLRVYRAAQDVARQDRGYRFGGGHRCFLASVGPRDALDCSGSASLILHNAGLFGSDEAWTSGRLAQDWGEEGEGRQVTLWASEEQVWLEFRLDPDHAERFDPTPIRLAPHAGWLTRMRRGPDGAIPRHLPGL